MFVCSFLLFDLNMTSYFVISKGSDCVLDGPADNAFILSLFQSSNVIIDYTLIQKQIHRQYNLFYTKHQKSAKDILGSY